MLRPYVIKEIIDTAKVIVIICSAEKEKEIGDKTCNVFEFNKEVWILVD